MRNCGLKLVMTLCAALLVSACATVPDSRDERDPWESYNRAMFGFNETVDGMLIKPIAKGYVTAVPKPARTGIGNFLSNLDDVVIAINNLLQGKVGDAASDAARVFVNSTLGIVGLFDVASRMGLEKHNEDFGQTLATWGMGSGPYFVLPLLGPSTVRDAPGLYVDLLMHPLDSYDDEGVRNSLVTLDVIDARAGLLSNDKLLDETGGDRYTVVRNAWLSRRDHLVHDGNPPVRNGADDLLRELEEMEEMEDELISEPPIGLENREPTQPRSDGLRPDRDDRVWLQAQDPAHFTIQIAAFGGREDPAEYARRHGLEGQSVMAVTTSQGHSWHVLVVGSYPALSEARAAMAKLPPAVKMNGPWIRSFGSMLGDFSDV